MADIRRFDFASGVILFAGSPVRNTAGKVVGGVILAQPVAQLHKLTAVLQMLLIMTAAVTVLLAVVMAMKMTQVLTNPIRRLTQVARRISEGEYGARIALGTQDELGELGNTLNTLSARLSNVIERLREERDKLELIIGSIGEGIIAVNADFRSHPQKSGLPRADGIRRRGTCRLRGHRGALRPCTNCWKTACGPARAARPAGTTPRSARSPPPPRRCSASAGRTSARSASFRTSARPSASNSCGATTWPTSPTNCARR